MTGKKALCNHLCKKKEKKKENKEFKEKYERQLCLQKQSLLDNYEKFSTISSISKFPQNIIWEVSTCFNITVFKQDTEQSM